MSAEGRPPTQRPQFQGPQIAAQRVEAERVRQEQVRIEQARKREDEESRIRQSDQSGGERNVFFNDRTGQWEFIVAPTHEDPFGTRPVSKYDVNKDYFATPRGSELKKQFDEAEFAQNFQIFRETQAQMRREGYSEDEIKSLTQEVTTSEGSQDISVKSTFDQRVNLPQASDREIVNQLQQNVQKETLGYGRLESYSISRDREGRVTDVSGSVFLPTFIPNMRAQQAQITRNIPEGYADLTKTPIRGERVPLHYKVGIGEGKESTFEVFERDSGKRVPLHYHVDLEDRLSGGPYHYYRDIGKPDKQVFEGTAPFMDLPEKDDPLAGFVNVFKNIGEFGASGAGHFREAKYEPEVEASIFSGLFGVGKRFVERKPAELQLTLAAKEFGEIGQFIQKRPAYAAGSIAASAALWFFPYGKVVSGARSALGISKAARAAPRARFDYDPLRGSFADRPSVRFGPYNPTRWENPEALAELAKYRADLSRFKPVIAVAPSGRAFSYQIAKELTHDETGRHIETGKVVTVIRERPLTDAMVKVGASSTSKVESVGLVSAKQSVQKAVTEASQSRGAGRSARPSVSYERSIAGVSLGLGGVTGAERRRRIIPTEYESYVLAYPQTTKNFLGSTLKNLGISRTDTGMRSFLQNLTGTRSRAATSSRSILSEITGLRGAEMQGFRLGQLSLTRTAQVQTPKVASELRSLLRTTGISVPRPRTPTLRIPKAVLFPGFTQSRKRKAKGSRRTRVGLRTHTASDYVAAIAGKELGKQFKKITGSY